MPKASPLRIGLALLWVVLTVTYIARNAFVAAFADTNLDRAERLWAGHPSVLSARAMIEVGQAAARARPLGSGTHALVNDVALAEPLAPQPFLIAGAEAQRNGDIRKAKRLLLSARHRDPREPAARFLLAEQYISEGRLPEGVSEAAVLGRLLPESREPLAQAFARYIQTTGISRGMDAILRSNPELAEGILNNLAANPANADLLLNIAASIPPRAVGPAPGWKARLVNELVQDGEYTRARQVWAKLAGGTADASAGIYDPRFQGSPAPPPFNWTLATQGAVIEPQAGGLHILYFGRDDLTLASQLLVLRPGRYGLQLKVSGQVADPQTLRWKISCASAKNIILDQPLGRGRLEAAFSVPSKECGAQQFELVARAVESARSSDFLVSDLKLEVAGPQ